MPAKFSKTCAAAVLGAGLASAAQAYYKCSLPDGGVAFQQTPCGDATTQMQLNLPAPSAASPQAADTAAKKNARSLAELAAEAEQKKVVREAIQRRQPAVGMTRDELDQALGKPDRVNLAQYGSSTNDQLIYHRRGRTLYVYLRNGVVTSIQNTAGTVLTLRKPCPSASEIRDLEIEISKFANRDNPALQRDLHARLADAKACR